MHLRFTATTLAVLIGIAVPAAAEPPARHASYVAASEATPHPVPQADTFRTLCVRLCDGYYFPISTKTTRLGLDADAARCNASCTSESRLFFHPNPGGDVASARDFTGLHYESLANAFRYLRQSVDGCRCKPQPWSSEEVQRHRRYAAQGRPPESTGTVTVRQEEGTFDFTAQGERPLAVQRRAAPPAPEVPPPPPAVETPAISQEPKAAEPARPVPAADKADVPAISPKLDAPLPTGDLVVAARNGKPDATAKKPRRIKGGTKIAAADCEVLRFLLQPHVRRR